MLKPLAFVGLAVALTAAQAAFAQPSGYGTEGPNGRRLDARAQSTYQRHWNSANESKYRAEESARWMRHHGEGFPNPF
ncbi:hypothetical protein DFR50_105106 [Roseiarcus fermentans]|uniref:Uncharacterized protein n=1 Tax=Roseiarcus fermentans TaxID=1473586 RepID=A0A366FP47_9HYPH|nr:hypothetical protein [Roseiarcus fermentans]RBP16463.1 hypothetical protein DFR50_105106 [Roseiarcus fermentans]